MTGHSGLNTLKRDKRATNVRRPKDTPHISLFIRYIADSDEG